MKWFPIHSNKLPNQGEKVLVTYLIKDEIPHIGEAFLREGVWLWEDDSEEVTAKITAWAYHEPYKENQAYADDTEDAKTKNEINIVTVRWFDSYMEEFRATEVRVGGSFLWMRLENGITRQIPLTQVRWISPSIESHQRVL